jgi:mono/diheme cytochrome c family protein
MPLSRLERRAGKKALQSPIGERFMLARRLARAISIATVFCCGLSQAYADENLARGAYLARITGCLGCHSPRNLDGSVIETQLLSGGDHPIHVAGGGAIYPPNITSDPANGIGGWSVADIAASIKKGVTPDGRTLSAAMPWRSQYSELDDADALAIATYVKSAPPVNRKTAPSPASAEAPNHEGQTTKGKP